MVSEVRRSMRVLGIILVVGGVLWFISSVFVSVLYLIARFGGELAVFPIATVVSGFVGGIILYWVGHILYVLGRAKKVPNETKEGTQN